MTKVLVVDDSLSVRKVVERALAGRGSTWCRQRSGSVALELIERESPRRHRVRVIIPIRTDATSAPS